jgi:peptidoglycan/xylan/chitin deacetylase (PgdA/CDA1 family)
MLRRIYRRLASNRSLPRTSIACLMFHRIAEVKEEEIGPYPAITISPQAFEDIIAFFSKHFRAMALPDLVTHLATRTPLPANTFAVTFDDGFVDTWSVAKPILEKFEVPATVYVTTGYIGGEVFPYEFELADLIASRDGVHFNWDGGEYCWDFKNTQDRERCYAEIKRIGKPYSYPLRRDLMTKILGESELPKAKGSLFMNWRQVIELSQSPLITIGAHTHRHVLLPSLTHEAARDEINSSKNILQAKLEGPVHHFSYPYGASDQRIQSIVQSCGFTSAVGGKPGGIYPQFFECFAIPRIELKEPLSPNLHTIPEVIHACGFS